MRSVQQVQPVRDTPPAPTALPARLQSARPDKPRWITPEPLNVAPALVGLPLARPCRRALAMGLDLVLVALLSGISGFWLLEGLVLVVVQLRSQRGSTTKKRLVVGWLGAGVLALLALQEARTDWAERDDESAAPVVQIAADTAAVTPAVITAATASAPTAASPAASAQARIQELEAALADARKPVPLRRQFRQWWESMGAKLGWGIVYFSLLPAWWGGQTVGKKIVRIRVLELTGQPMTVLRCLKRYGGYAAGMATGGLGFAQMLWDPNRQALQDKAAHTAVVDSQALRLLPAEPLEGQTSAAEPADS